MIITVLLFLAVITVLVGAARHRVAPLCTRPAPRELVRRALAVIPASGDRVALGHAVERVLATDPRVDVVVVERPADDEPWIERPHPRISTLRQADPCNPAAALRAGAAQALHAGYDAVIELSVEDVPFARSTTALLEALDDGAHVAVGSRHVPGARVAGQGAHRRALSRAANRLLAAAARVPLHDVTARIRAYRRDAVESAILHTQGDGRDCAVEVMLRCRQAGLRFTEVPVTADAARCATHRVRDGYAMVRRALAWRAAALPVVGVRAWLRPLTAVLSGR